MARVRARELLFPVLVAHAIFPGLWLIRVVSSGPEPNDWLHLKVVANHFVSGDWARLYAVGENALNPGYFWRYPPFALYLVAPLAWLPDVWAYALLAGVEIGALVASLYLLQRLAPFREMRSEWVLAVAFSAPALTTVITGQSSALIMLCVVLAATLWSREKVVRSCALLGLLAIKPNWGVVFGLFGIMKGARRGVAMMVGSVAVLCAATVPLGWQLWKDFLSVSLSNGAILADYDPSRQITLRAFLEWLFGQNELAFALWVIMAASLTLMTALAWRVRGPALRHLGLALLLAVAVNPYASFYDALVLAVPATVWWAERDDWERGPWLTVGWLVALAWTSEQWQYSWGLVLRAIGLEWLPPVSLVGPVAATWLVLAARQAARARPVQENP